MDRVNIINHFIQKNNYKTYLNIGVFTGYTLDHVICDNKMGVDPFPEHYKGEEEVIPTTSDVFFKSLSPEKKFECIFIDGSHLEEDVLKDIENSLKHLSGNGVILLHDCSPKKWEHAQREWLEPEWNGTVWKAVLKFQAEDVFGYYSFYTINTDYGIGVIKKNNIVIESMHNPQDYYSAMNSWSLFQENKEKLLNLISVEEFLEKES
jgi:hypothetical protein